MRYEVTRGKLPSGKESYFAVDRKANRTINMLEVPDYLTERDKERLRMFIRGCLCAVEGELIDRKKELGVLND